MGLNDVYRKYLLALQKIYSPDEAAQITSIVFEHFAGFNRSEVIKNPARILPEPLNKQLEEALQQLLKHKPVQYITGEAWFSGIKLKVTNVVLIPRPETEELVQEAIDSIGTKKLSLLDIGTGSGCISIAIKKKKKDTAITALDISDDALKVALENAKTQKADIDFRQLDFLDEANWIKLKTFDLIVSNPPYIPNKEKDLLDKNVKDHEPHMALFVADDAPLIFYKKIAAFGETHLNKEGKILMETHADYAKDVAAYFEQAGYKVQIKKDLFEKERIVLAEF